MKREEELIEEALQGNHIAFEQLLHPYRNGLLNMVYRMTGNPEDAKEICQDALIKIYRYLRSFKKGRSFKNWLYKTVVNTARDFLKKQKRFDLLMEQQKNSADCEKVNPEKHYLDAEIRENIQNCLQWLTPTERAVFCLRDGEGLSIKEAASVPGCSSMGIRVDGGRASTKLRLELGELDSFKNSEVKR